MTYDFFKQRTNLHRQWSFERL